MSRIIEIDLQPLKGFRLNNRIDIAFGQSRKRIFCAMREKGASADGRCYYFFGGMLMLRFDDRERLDLVRVSRRAYGKVRMFGAEILEMRDAEVLSFLAGKCHLELEKDLDYMSLNGYDFDELGIDLWRAVTPRAAMNSSVRKVCGYEERMTAEPELYKCFELVQCSADKKSPLGGLSVVPGFSEPGISCAIGNCDSLEHFRENLQ